MARGFGSTQGVNTSDLVLVSCPIDPNAKTVSIWTTRNGNGAGGFTTPFARVGCNALYQGVVASTYNFAQIFATGFHNWSFAQPSANAAHHIAVVYDSTSEANNPIIYLDGAVQLLTKTGAATGSPISATTDYKVGQTDTTGTEWWDGVLSEFAVWRGLLSADRITQLAAGVPAAFVQPGDLLTYCPIWGINAPEYQFIKTLQKSAVTGTSAKAHPIVIAQGIACAEQAVGMGY